MDFLIFFLIYFLITLSVIGYGVFFSTLIGANYFLNSHGYSGLIGLFFLTIYSYISNIFFAHSEIHNTLLIFLGLSFLTYKLLKEKKIF